MHCLCLARLGCSLIRSDVAFASHSSGRADLLSNCVAFAVPCLYWLCRCRDGLIVWPLCQRSDSLFSDLRCLRFAFFGSCCPAKHWLFLCRAGPCKTRPCRGYATPRLALLCLCFVMPLSAKPLPSLSVPFDSARRYDMPLPRRAQIFSDARCLCVAMREREMPHHAVATPRLALPLLGLAAPRLTTPLPCRAQRLASVQCLCLATRGGFAPFAEVPCLGLALS